MYGYEKKTDQGTSFETPVSTSQSLRRSARISASRANPASVSSASPTKSNASSVLSATFDTSQIHGRASFGRLVAKHGFRVKRKRGTENSEPERDEAFTDEESSEELLSKSRHKRIFAKFAEKVPAAVVAYESNEEDDEDDSIPVLSKSQTKRILKKHSTQLPTSAVNISSTSEASSNSILTKSQHKRVIAKHSVKFPAAAFEAANSSGSQALLRDQQESEQLHGDSVSSDEIRQPSVAVPLQMTSTPKRPVINAVLNPIDVSDLNVTEKTSTNPRVQSEAHSSSRRSLKSSLTKLVNAESQNVAESDVVPKKKRTRADLRSNDNIISKQKIASFHMYLGEELSKMELEKVHKVSNAMIGKFLDQLCRSTTNPNGMFTYKELEKALQTQGWISAKPNILALEFATAFTPEKLRKMQGILIPNRGENDT